MPVLLTDSVEAYDQYTSKKILTDGFVIIRSDFLSDEQILHFNAQLNGIENEASKLMIEELESVCKNFPPFRTHPFLETRKTTFDKAYSLFYADFKDYITKKYLIELLVGNLKRSMDIDQLNCNFSADFRSISFSKKLLSSGTIKIRPQVKLANRRLIRNLFYRVSQIKRRQKLRPVDFNKKRIGLFIFDTANDIDLFKTFFELVKNDPTVHLDVVQIDSGVAPEKIVSAKPFEDENIRVYQLQDFRAPLQGGLSEFYNAIKTKYPEYCHFIGSKRMISVETYTAFFNAALTELKPQTVLYDNTGEVGRYLSDVARFHTIKSANVEYGLFSDDFIHMASNICFDIRYCLGEASIEIWKNKKDPSKQHVPIGFLKLDHSEHLGTLEDNFHWIRGTYDKLIFFASTWAGTNSLYNIEKSIVVKELSELCAENKWGLIIKKHPAEKDSLIDDLEEVRQQHVHLYQHHEAQLFQILEHCDIVCTQNSSITAEALLHRKPTVFYNKSKQPGLAELIPMSKEPFVYFANNTKQFADIMHNQIPLLTEEVYKNALSKYLYKTDQNASFRLLEGLKKLSL